MRPDMVTTALGLPGWRVMRNVGVVRGIVVRSRSVFVTSRDVADFGRR